MLPTELIQLRRLLRRALADTAPLWPTVARGFAWVHRAARILANERGLSGRQVRRQFSGLLGAMSRWRSHAGELASAVARFLKVSRSYWPGLFHCYDIKDLPRTNNDLEHLFGSFRYHERRASGRAVAAPAIVVRGAARMVAAVATRQRAFSAADLALCDNAARQALRAALERRRQARVQQRRFRCNSAAYLASLEVRLIKLILPT